MKKKIRIGILGLGYVGLPLFLEFSKKFDVRGFDLSKEKIKQLLKSKDHTNQFWQLTFLHVSIGLHAYFLIL